MVVAIAISVRFQAVRRTRTLSCPNLTRLRRRARDPRKHDKADERTARQLRQGGLIDRSTTVTHATDTAEPLLWLPDGVAWSVRRSLSAPGKQRGRSALAGPGLQILVRRENLLS